MAKKIKIKTQKNKKSVSQFLATIKDANLKKDSQILVKLFKKASGKKAVMWGSAIIGFGEYTYFRSNGDYAQFCAVGFSPRKSGPTLYILPYFLPSQKIYDSLLKKMGPYKKSKGCLYLKNLVDIDLKVLEKLVKQSYKDTMKKFSKRKVD